MIYSSKKYRLLPSGNPKKRGLLLQDRHSLEVEVTLSSMINTGEFKAAIADNGERVYLDSEDKPLPPEAKNNHICLDRQLSQEYQRLITLAENSNKQRYTPEIVISRTEIMNGAILVTKPFTLIDPTNLPVTFLKKDSSLFN